MTLTSALRSATSSLRALQTQTSIASTNIANAQTPGATRKYANVITNSTGGVEVVSIGQASNASVFYNLLTTTASTAQWTSLADGLDQLARTVGDTTDKTSPASLIGNLSTKLTTLAATPGSYDLARSAAMAARDLTTSLNQATLTVQGVRDDANKQITEAAQQMNTLLAKIETLNKQVISGTATNSDVTDLVDERNRAILSLSEYVGVTVRTRNDNDVVLYTDSGVTLFETTARHVDFDGGKPMDATVTEGPALRIDGSPVTGANAVMPLASGKIVGLIKLRDEVAVTYQSQLDEVARSLVDAFSESDQTDPASLADRTGLFGNRTSIDTPKVVLGTYSGTGIAAGDALTFSFSYGDKTYKASHVFTASEVPMTAAKYEAALKSAVDGAVGPDGTVLGAGKITAKVDASNTISLTPEGAGVYKAFSLSNVFARTHVAGKTGGLTAVSGNGTAATAGIPASGSATGTASTGASLALGNFSASNIAAGDTLTFDFQYNGVAYKASKIFATAPADAAAYAAAVQSAIAEALPASGGTAALGAGKVLVTGDNGTGAISAVTSAVGTSQAIAVSNAKVGRPALVTAATYASGIAAGDVLTFDLQMNGTTYKVSQTFTTAPTNAAEYATALQNAINGAVSVPAGKVLGSGKVTVSQTSGVVSFATVAGGTSQSLGVSNITASVATGDPSKTGGLVAGAAPATITGLAGTLTLNEAVVNNPQLLRDGGINGGSYVSNKESAGGFNARINQMLDALSATRRFKGGTDADPSATIAGFAASSVSWLQGERSATKSEVDYQATLLASTQKSLSNETGVNMADELTQLIQLERSYQASSKIISTVDNMLQTLMQAIG